MKKKLSASIYSLILIVILFFSFNLLFTHLVNAAGDTVPAANSAVLNNPLGDNNMTANSIISKLIKTILGLTGVAALLMFIWGGFTWLTSAGNAKKIEQGKNTVVWAILGIALIFASRIILNAVLEAF